MEAEFVDCQKEHLEVKQEVPDDVDPLADSSGSGEVELEEHKVKVEILEESADTTENENCDLTVKQEIIEVVENMKVEKDEDSSEVKLPGSGFCDVYGTTFASSFCWEQKEEPCQESEDRFVEEPPVLQSQNTGETEKKTRHRDANRDRFKCTFCSYSSSRSYNIKIHLATHTGERPFKCEFCNKTFVQSAHLREHLRSHSGEKPYTCDVCNKSFTFSSNLKHHRVIHGAIKPFKCTVCSYACNQKIDLKRHMKTHSREETFKCDLCNETFSRINEHKCTHTRDETNKCGICADSCDCPVKNSAEKKNYKCEECLKTFTRLHNLRLHRLTHTGEKRFVCSECDYACNRQCDLRKHMTKHSGARPFKCDQCARAFTRSGYLSEHKLIVHKWHEAQTQCPPQLLFS